MSKPIEIDNWNHNPSDIFTDSSSRIIVENVWENNSTNSVVVQYRKHAVQLKRNNYVEVFKNPEGYFGFVNKVEDLFGLNKKEDTTIRVTMGNKIASKIKKQQACRAAIKYMKENKLDNKDEIECLPDGSTLYNVYQNVNKNNLKDIKIPL